MSYKVETSNGKLHICTDHNGKMQGMLSISTSPVENPDCQKRQHIHNCVCEFCFSQAMHEQYSELANCTAENYHVLNDSVLAISELPIFNVAFARGESFGDAGSENACENILNIALKNPFTIFAIWTKQFRFWNNVFKRIPKPKNVIMVASSCFVNRPLSEKILVLYPWIDHVFTVYTADYALEHDITIHCGLSRCLRCLQCYRTDTPVYINEVLKDEQPYYYKARTAKNRMKIKRASVVSVSASEIAFFRDGKYHFYKVTTDPKYLYKVNKKTVSETTGNAQKVAEYINNNVSAMDALLSGRIYKKGA